MTTTAVLFLRLWICSTYYQDMEDGTCLEQIRNWIRGGPDDDDLEANAGRAALNEEPQLRPYDPRRLFRKKQKRIIPNVPRIPLPEAPPLVPEPHAIDGKVTLEDLKEELKEILERDEEITQIIEALKRLDDKLEEAYADDPPLQFQNDNTLTERLWERQSNVDRKEQAKKYREEHEKLFLRKASKYMAKIEGDVELVTPGSTSVLKPYLGALRKFLDTESAAKAQWRRLAIVKKRLAVAEASYERGGPRIERGYWARHCRTDVQKLRDLENSKAARFSSLKKRRKAFLNHESVQAWVKTTKSAETIMLTERYRKALNDLVYHRLQHDTHRNRYNEHVLINKGPNTSSTDYDRRWCKGYHDAEIGNLRVAENTFIQARKNALAQGAELLLLPMPPRDRLYFAEPPGYIPAHGDFPGRPAIGRDVQKCNLDNNGLYEPPEVRPETEKRWIHRWVGTIVAETAEEISKLDGKESLEGQWAEQMMANTSNRITNSEFDDLASAVMFETASLLADINGIVEAIDEKRAMEGEWDCSKHRVIKT